MNTENTGQRGQSNPRQTVPQMWRLSERQLMGGTVGVLGGRGREGQADREEGSTKGCR